MKCNHCHTELIPVTVNLNTRSTYTNGQVTETQLVPIVPAKMLNCAVCKTSQFDLSHSYATNNTTRN